MRGTKDSHSCLASNSYYQEQAHPNNLPGEKPLMQLSFPKSVASLLRGFGSPQLTPPLFRCSGLNILCPRQIRMLKPSLQWDGVGR